MLNIRRKRLSFKTSIVLAIVLLVCVFVSMLFGFLQTNQIKSDYYRDIAFSTEYLKQDIYEVFARADNALRESGADPNSIPEPFYRDVTGFVFITSDAQAVFASKEPVLNLVVNTQFLSDIIPKVESSQDGFYRDITTLRDIFTDEEIRNDSVYFSIKNEDGIYVMAILDMKRVFSEVRDYGFESIRLLTSDVTFSCSDIDARLSQDFHAVIEADTKSRLLSNDAYADMAKIGRDKFIVSISERDQTYSALRLVVTKSPSELNSFIGIQTTHFLIEDITYVAIFSAAFVLLLLILMKDEGGFQFFNIRNSNYAIKVSSAGKILWKNNLFGEKFDYHTISDCIVSAGKNLSHTLALGKPVVLDLEDKDGDKHYLLMNVIRFAKIFRLVGADLTAEISTYRSLSHTDKYDNVTDLGMEWVFINQVSNLIAKGKGIKGALALMRLSNLSMLKIMLGEHLYKQLLMLYAGSLKREFAGMGELFVLKNGDFLLFNTNDSANTLINKLPAIMERLRQPVRLNENNIQLDAKLGVIVLNSRDANITANSLLSNAQRALEYAINSVKQNHYVLYPTSFSVSRTNFRADGVVKMMVDNGEIEAYFQPQYSLFENKIVGFEALCRIIGPKSAEINVGELISIAEQYGGMIDLGNYICDRAMAFAAEIQDSGIQIAVNVSPIQLMQAGFTSVFLDMFHKHKLKEGVFNIEITEGAALYSFEEAVAKLTIIKNRGVGIHIDDFGVAYSSMLHLKLLPATLLKIDKSLVDDIVESEDAKSIIRNIITLGKDLRLDIVAEGVEKQDQMDLLRELKCDMVQGYVISRAVPRLKAIELIKEVNKDA